MKRIEANKVIKTLHWVSQAFGDIGPVLESKLNEKGLYECVIYLPIIRMTVIGLGNGKLESIDNATKKSSDLIDEYLKRNPNIYFHDKLAKAKYILEEDDEGNLCIHLIQEGASC